MPAGFVCHTNEEQGSRTNIERFNSAIPNHEVPNIRHGSAYEDIIVNSNTRGPHGTTLLGGFLSVVFQSDGRWLSIPDG